VETVVSSIAALLTTAAFIPQAYKIIHTRETKGVSLWMHITFAVGVAFGLARGLAVLLTARRRTTSELFALHRRFDALGEPVRRGVIALQLVVAVAAAGAAWGVVAALVAAAVLAAGALVAVGARRRASSAVTA